MHKPHHLRQALQNYLDSDLPVEQFTVGHNDEEHNLDWLLRQLRHCTDIFPAGYCDQLDLAKGSHYAAAVRRIREELDIYEK